MAIYVFSLLTGFYFGGVDYAQGMRYQYLKNLNVPVKHIYNSVPSNRELDSYQEMGIDTGSMLVAPFALAGKTEIGKPEEITMKTMYSKGNIMAQEHYAGGYRCTDYYIPKQKDGIMKPTLAKRTFCNPDGTMAFEMLKDEQGKEWFWYPNGECLTKQEFLCKFIRSLNLTKDDIVIIDRPGIMDFVQPLFTYGNQAKIVVYFHAVHYAEPRESGEFWYLNYHYYYWFRNSDKIHTFVVSSEEQKKDLIEKLKEYGCAVPNVEVIPICGLDRLRVPKKKRKPETLVTASRLVGGKKIDWIIRSVVKAHEKNPNISIDIYGEGSEEQTKELQSMVDKFQAWEYIRFMGHQNMKERYTSYKAYISASLGESFGITLLEAVGSGLALLGLDAKYGNKVFIQDGKNGYLTKIDYSKVTDEEYVEDLISTMAENILLLFSEKTNLKQFQKVSYEIAENYMNPVIEKKWKAFIESLIAE